MKGALRTGRVSPMQIWKALLPTHPSPDYPSQSEGTRRATFGATKKRLSSRRKASSSSTPSGIRERRCHWPAQAAAGIRLSKGIGPAGSTDCKGYLDDLADQPLARHMTVHANAMPPASPTGSPGQGLIRSLRQHRLLGPRGSSVINLNAKGRAG